MSIPTEVIMKMATLGLSEEQAKAVADMLTAVETATAETFEAQIEAGKEKSRERWRKWKSTKSNVSKRLQTTANVSQQLAPVEDKTLTTVIEPQEKKQTHSADVDAFKAALSGVCDAERIEAIIKHRRTKRGQITGLAAKLFIRDAEACGLTVPQAVDTCISRNWITVNADWLKDRNQTRGSPPTPRPVDLLNEAINRMDLADADSQEEAPRNPAPAQLIPLRQSG